LARPFDQLAQSRASLGIWILDFSIRRELPYGVLVAAPAPEQRAADEEVRSLRFRDRDLLAELGHPRPGVVDVRHAVRAQAVEVIALEELLVADLDRVAVMTRQRGQEWIEQLEELAQLQAPERAELEDQGRDPVLVALERLQERLAQQVEIEKRRILESCLRSVARLDGKPAAGDLLGDLEREPERGGRLGEELLPEVLGRELVEGEIAADGRESGRVLLQALGFESFFRETAVMQIVPPRIDLAEPAFVLPGAGSDENALAGQPDYGSGELFMEGVVFEEAEKHHAKPQSRQALPCALCVFACPLFTKPARCDSRMGRPRPRSRRPD